MKLYNSQNSENFKKIYKLYINIKYKILYKCL